MLDSLCGSHLSGRVEGASISRDLYCIICGFIFPSTVPHGSHSLLKDGKLPGKYKNIKKVKVGLRKIEVRENFQCDSLLLKKISPFSFFLLKLI